MTICENVVPLSKMTSFVLVGWDGILQQSMFGELEMGWHVKDAFTVAAMAVAGICPICTHQPHLCKRPFIKLAVITTRLHSVTISACLTYL